MANSTATFNVVPDEFPLDYDGIIGSDLMRTHSGKIDFTSDSVILNGEKFPFSHKRSIILPGRQKTLMYIKVANPSVQEGYEPRLNVQDGVYLGEAIVSNTNGIAYIYAINTQEKDVTVEVPVVPLYPFDTSTDEDSSIAQKETLEHTPGNRVSKVLNLLRLDHLNSEERKAVSILVEENVNLFHIPGDPLRATNMLRHTIVTKDELPVNTRQYRYPPYQKAEIEKQIVELIKTDIIQSSKSPYNSPLWIVPKKEDSKGNKRWRLVIDYRKLNEKTIGDAYPLPLISDILDQLGGAKYFSIFDLASGFHQIEMNLKDKQKTAFTTPHGHYEFNRMPFGLKNAPATFQRLMDLALTGLQGTELFVYLDDIVIYSRSLVEHASKFKRLAERLRQANLTLQTDKCEFLRTEVRYLGHIISANAVQPNPQKIEAVKKFPIPKTQKNVKEFLGLAGYYRKFIKDFAKIAKPLSDLTSKNSKFSWNSQHQLAFEELRDCLCTAPILKYPDFSQPFVVTTDASGFALGAVLSQGKIGEDTPVTYASRVLNKHEKNYSTTEKEMLATIFALKTFRSYLYGRPFTLVTDHRPLVWINSMNDPTSRVMRWRERLKEFEFNIQYKAGRADANADALSRNPIIPEEAEIYPIKVKWNRRSDNTISMGPGIARLRSSSDSAEHPKKILKKGSTQDETDLKVTFKNDTSSDENFRGYSKTGINQALAVGSHSVKNKSSSEEDFLGFPPQNTVVPTNISSSQTPWSNDIRATAENGSRQSLEKKSSDEDFFGFAKSDIDKAKVFNLAVLTQNSNNSQTKNSNPKQTLVRRELTKGTHQCGNTPKCSPLQCNERKSLRHACNLNSTKLSTNKRLFSSEKQDLKTGSDSKSTSIEPDQSIVLPDYSD